MTHGRDLLPEPLTKEAARDLYRQEALRGFDPFTDQEPTRSFRSYPGWPLSREEEQSIENELAEAFRKLYGIGD